ncbi:Zn-dependent protease [Chthonomonas calidirosea]|uniref:Zinc metalloprotease n=1 Tax=Chthonomonas calidirosea (strain DSM 23976 / ICMP 18418 / T49) TaxID=1303518 RepID=S0EUW1_CHTCT|nr:site-2 protease family protein [Chthonomonas calidirosea]CCW34137.1 Zn-dependent proteases [Chthonomonas calidirosea T49]CEK15654.1 Zn-dependent protease [Chthonomonas calidirosea]
MTPIPPQPPEHQSASPFRRPQNPFDSGSFLLAVIAGIPIRIHFTFLLLLVLVAATGIGGNQGHSLISVIYVILLFACVVLHELGHALTARRYGIRTYDIVLYPIGGVARLQNLPDVKSELWIALAGPAVNVVLAALLGIAIAAAGVPFDPSQIPAPLPRLVVDLFWSNIALFAFNMLPAFPMDGGRVLRSFLAKYLDVLVATRIAASIGQGLALLLGLWSLFTLNPLLLLIAVFVFVAAGQEANAYQTHLLATGHTVREAMLRDFHTLSVGDTLRTAAEKLLSGSQHDFPVVFGEEVQGVLTRADLLRGLAQEGPDAYVAGVMQRDFTYVYPNTDLEQVLQAFTPNKPILVMEPPQTPTDSPKLIGMLNQENVLEFLIISHFNSRPHRLD